MTAALRGSLAPQRAAIALSLVAGVQMMRQMIGLAPLLDGDPSDLVEILAGLFEPLVAGGTD
ncbi:MAG TPA: hypothetical protein VMR86_22435 [Myxococcota bacterium]|nr:hypothetical protein [Myxococcota bacterium]